MTGGLERKNKPLASFTFMKSPSRRARVFYIGLGSINVLTRPFERIEGNREKAKVIADASAVETDMMHYVLSASEYRDLVGSSASADYRAELNS